MKKCGRSPFATGAEALTFLSFSLAAIYLLLEFTTRVDPHGGSFYILAALLAALGVPGLVEAINHPPAVEARESIRTWHVGIGLLSAAAVLVGGLLAAGYLGSYFRVKRHKLAQGSGGMALSSFGRLTRNATFVSVVLLGVATSLGLTMSLRDDAPRGVGFLTVTMACVFGLLFCAWFIWWRRPVRGALAAWLNVGGVALMAISIAIIHPLVVGAS